MSRESNREPANPRRGSHTRGVHAHSKRYRSAGARKRHRAAHGAAVGGSPGVRPRHRARRHAHVGRGRRSWWARMVSHGPSGWWESRSAWRRIRGADNEKQFGDRCAAGAGNGVGTRPGTGEGRVLRAAVDGPGAHRHGGRNTDHDGPPLLGGSHDRVRADARRRQQDHAQGDGPDLPGRRGPDATRGARDGRHGQVDQHLRPGRPHHLRAGSRDAHGAQVGGSRGAADDATADRRRQAQGRDEDPGGAGGQRARGGQSRARRAGRGPRAGRA